MKNPRSPVWGLCRNALLGVLILVSAACGAPTSQIAERGAVPWIDTPGVAAQLAAVVAAKRSCRAQDLQVTVGPSGAYLGRATQELTIHNAAPDACFIPTPPTLAAVRGNGQRVPVASDPMLDLGGLPGTETGLASEKDAHVLIGVPATCPNVGSPDISTTMTLTLLTQEVFTVSGTRLDLECGNPTLLIFDLRGSPAATGPQSLLRASLLLPSSAAPGQVFVYFVALSNPSTQTFPLTPCPSYTQVFGVGNPVRQTLLLNCAGAVGVAPHSSTTFEIRMAIPVNAERGVTKLGWQLDIPGGAFAGSAVTVT